MTYRVEFTPSAHRQFARLPREIVRRIDKHIRVVYTVEHHALIVLVVRVGHRRDVYRGL